VEPSPASHESRVKDAVDDRIPSGSIGRFKTLATRLFGIKREEFMKALEKDEKERRENRGG
jgi:hypothetical protein